MGPLQQCVGLRRPMVAGVDLPAQHEPDRADLIHSRRVPQRAIGDSRASGLGVAYYKAGTNNNQYRYMGLVIQALGEPDHFNIGLAPYLIDGGGNIYLYFADLDSSGNRHMAVAPRQSREPRGGGEGGELESRVAEIL